MGQKALGHPARRELGARLREAPGVGACGCVPTAGASVGTEHLPWAVRGGGEADPWQPGFLLVCLPGAGSPGILLLFHHSVVSNSLWPHGLQHTRLLCPPLSPGIYSNSYPLSWWCHPVISSSVIPFSSDLQSFPASGSFPRSQFFASGGQKIEALALVSVLPMNIQDWLPLGLTGLITLQSKGLSRVFSNITVQKHQFFCTQECKLDWPLWKTVCWLLK